MAVTNQAECCAAFGETDNPERTERVYLAGVRLAREIDHWAEVMGLTTAEANRVVMVLLATGLAAGNFDTTSMREAFDWLLKQANNEVDTFRMHRAVKAGAVSGTGGDA